jgi:hypothetical protein
MILLGGTGTDAPGGGSPYHSDSPKLFVSTSVNRHEFGGASPTLIWNDILQVKYSTFYWSFLHILKNALVQATSTMHQSDIRGLVSTKRPEPTLICYVKSCAFYGREYRTNVAAHIGWVAFSSYRAHTKSIIPFLNYR